MPSNRARERPKEVNQDDLTSKSRSGATEGSGSTAKSFPRKTTAWPQTLTRNYVYASRGIDSESDIFLLCLLIEQISFSPFDEWPN
ncbi:hypothetical protein E5288_WYG009753 [Bos mutus]|uniref:Uncharacterized protein n=1 Tax=Bos mutus TaxID=72004 RepID=A0A6B0R0Y2_9CETA|nr:hypothetical protein [Bos mutus]